MGIFAPASVRISVEQAKARKGGAKEAAAPPVMASFKTKNTPPLSPVLAEQSPYGPSKTRGCASYLWASPDWILKPRASATECLMFSAG